MNLRQRLNPFLASIVCIPFYLGVFGLPSSVMADGTPPTEASSNYEKAQDLLPGEKVVTPTGQVLKVWSTRGPVEVSPAPEPFADPKKTNIDDAHILIEADKHIHRHDRGELEITEELDSFEIE